MNELQHHGILGQKWGIRRFQNSDGTLTEAGKNRYEKASEKERRKQAIREKKADSRNRSTMTEEELRKKIQKLQMEKQLRELTNEEIYPGKKAAMNVLQSIGTKVITTAVTGAALYGLKAAVSKNFKAKEFGEAIFNGGAKKK